MSRIQQKIDAIKAEHAEKHKRPSIPTAATRQKAAEDTIEALVKDAGQKGASTEEARRIAAEAIRDGQRKRS